MLSTGLLTPLSFALVAASITTVGLIAVRVRAAWTRRNAGLFAAFAAGALSTVAILHLTPDALALTAHAPTYFFAGFAGAFLINRGVLALSDAQGQAHLAAGLTPMLAIGLHSFIDGVVYTVTFSVSAASGLLTTVGLILHEFPEGIIVYALLHHAGFSPRHAFLLAFLAAAATTPLGALLAYPLVDALRGPGLGDLYAVAAGVLLYVSAGHLLPHVEREPALRGLPAAALGAVVALAMIATHGHSHEADGHAPGQTAAAHDHDHAHELFRWRPPTRDGDR
ncbi:MAG: ZIP family metal transporter [Caulobacterales bacterium]|nr:ZIP family metal transporter [Caulobacterales bacterium]